MLIQVPGRVLLPRVYQEQIREHIKDVCAVNRIDIAEFCVCPIHLRVNWVDFWPATHRFHVFPMRTIGHGLDAFWKAAKLPMELCPTNPAFYRSVGKKQKYLNYPKVDLYAEPAQLQLPPAPNLWSQS